MLFSFLVLPKSLILPCGARNIEGLSSLDAVLEKTLWCCREEMLRKLKRAGPVLQQMFFEKVARKQVCCCAAGYAMKRISWALVLRTVSGGRKVASLAHSQGAGNGVLRLQRLRNPFCFTCVGQVSKHGALRAQKLVLHDEKRFFFPSHLSSSSPSLGWPTHRLGSGP